MSHNISDRVEYTDAEYAKMRITEIEAIMDTNDLSIKEIAEYEDELALLEKVLNPTAINTIDNDNLDNQHNGIHKLIIFKSETDDCIDMVLDVQNWDENFNHEVDIAVHKWQNSDDEYTLVITEHLESVGYIFTLRDDCEIYSDYS